MQKMNFVFVVLLVYVSFLCGSSSGLKCYECTGYVPCGSGQTHLLVNCPGKCIVYQNQFDGGWSWLMTCNCGENGMNMYEGRYAYVCSTDACNGQQADPNLIGGVTEGEGSGEEIQSTTTAVTTKTSSRASTVTIKTTQPSTVTIKTTQSSSLSCHECTGHYSGCGTSPHTIIHNCRMCMVYRNVWDGNTIVRRCCYWNCGAPNSVSQYEGRQAYFCASSLCNGIGSENALPTTRGQFLGGDLFPNN